MNIVYVPLGEAKVSKSACFSDLEISGATFTLCQTGEFLSDLLGFNQKYHPPTLIYCKFQARQKR